MRLKNDGGSWSGWTSYATSKSWTLKKANGVRTVYVQYRDKAGNASTAVLDRITLDTIKPKVSGMSPRHRSTIADRTPTIKATVKDTNNRLTKTNMTLYVANKKVAKSKFSYNRKGQLVYNAPNLGKGKKVVKIVARDGAGNVAARSWFFTIR